MNTLNFLSNELQQSLLDCEPLATSITLETPTHHVARFSYATRYTDNISKSFCSILQSTLFANALSHAHHAGQIHQVVQIRNSSFKIQFMLFTRVSITKFLQEMVSFYYRNPAFKLKSCRNPPISYRVGGRTHPPGRCSCCRRCARGRARAPRAHRPDPAGITVTT